MGCRGRGLVLSEGHLNDLLAAAAAILAVNLDTAAEPRAVHDLELGLVLSSAAMATRAIWLRSRIGAMGMGVRAAGAYAVAEHAAEPCRAGCTVALLGVRRAVEVVDADVVLPFEAPPAGAAVGGAAVVDVVNVVCFD